MKIIDRINLALEEEKREKQAALDKDPDHEWVDRTWYSYEYFPPKTTAGEENLVDRIARMATTNPLWVDVTWGPGGGTFNQSLDLCAHITQNMGLDVLMHLTCTGLSRDRVVEALDTAK